VNALVYSPVWMLLFTLLCECSCLPSCVNALVYPPVWMLLFTLLCECSCLLSCVNALIYSPVWMLLFTLLCECSYLLSCVNALRLACVGAISLQGLVYPFVFTLSGLLALALLSIRVAFTFLCLHFQACLLRHCFQSGSRLPFCVYNSRLACLGTAFNQGLVSFFVFTLSSLLA